MMEEHFTVQQFKYEEDEEGSGIKLRFILPKLKGKTNVF